MPNMGTIMSNLEKLRIWNIIFKLVEGLYFHTIHLNAACQVSYTNNTMVMRLKG